jgi:hypothetical protein
MVVLSMSKVSLDVSIEDNTAIAKEELESVIYTILSSIGMEAEGFAKDGTPVDTGRLRNSITWATQAEEGKQFSYSDENGVVYEDAVGTGVDARTVAIGTNVEYGERIEEGGRGYGGKHMLRNAISDHGDRYKAISEAALRAGK